MRHDSTEYFCLVQIQADLQTLHKPGKSVAASLFLPVHFFGIQTRTRDIKTKVEFTTSI